MIRCETRAGDPLQGTCYQEVTDFPNQLAAAQRIWLSPTAISRMVANRLRVQVTRPVSKRGITESLFRVSQSTQLLMFLMHYGILLPADIRARL